MKRLRLSASVSPNQAVVWSKLSRKLAFLGGKTSCPTGGNRAAAAQREAMRIGMMVGKVQPERAVDRAFKEEFCTRSSGAARRQK